MHRSRYYVFAVLSLHQYDSLTFSNFASTATWAFLYPIYRYIGKDLFLSRTFVSEHVSFLFSHAFISWFGFMHVRWHRIVAMSPFKIMEANTWFLMLYSNVPQCMSTHIFICWHVFASLRFFMCISVRTYLCLFCSYMCLFAFSHLYTCMFTLSCFFTRIHAHTIAFGFSKYK